MAESKDVRIANIKKIMDVFMTKGICTKKEIASLTGLSLGTCNNLLKILVEEKKIVRTSDCESTGGRRAKRYQLVDDQDDYAMVYQKDNSEYNLEVINLLGKTVATLTSENLEQLFSLMVEKYPQIKKVAMSLPAEKLKADFDFLKQYPFEVAIDSDNNYILSGYATTLEAVPECIVLLYGETSLCSLLVNGRIIHGFSHYAGSLANLFEDGSDKTIKAKKGVFAKKIVLLVTMLNPEIILLAQKKRSSFDKLESKLEKWIPTQHLPKLIPLENTEKLLKLGLKKACFSE